jgi:phosphatidylglycerophosphate synthase
VVTARRPHAARSGGSASSTSDAVLLATAPGGDGRPAAALPWEDGTVLGRLLGQLADLGVPTVHVVTRPGGEEALAASLADRGCAVRLHVSATVADDLALVAGIARTARAGLVVAYADIVTHREALAGLLADPRVATGILSTGGKVGWPFTLGTRSRRGRVVSAGSPYHHVSRGNARFLGVLKVGPADRPRLVEVAGRLAALMAPPLPAGWGEELEARAGRWRLSLARVALVRAQREAQENEDLDAVFPSPEEVELWTPEAVTLSPGDEVELRRRLAVAPEDAPALLLVGLVRDGAHVGNSYLRKLFWARPVSQEGIETAAERITEYDEDQVLLDSAVKGSDGFFTTFFVSPYSKHIARWAARRGLTPNQITTFSMAIGILAALAFATGHRPGLVAGAVLLQLAFTFDCVDGQLARYTRTFSKLGAWLDSVFDRGKEYVVFAGLAVGASRAGDPVWLLAGAALTLQTMRHAFDFSYAAAQHQVIAATVQPPLEQPGDGLHPALAGAHGEIDEPDAAHDGGGVHDGGVAADPVHDPTVATVAAPLSLRDLPARALSGWHVLDRGPGVRWLKKMIAFPIGERFAAISLAAALTGPRTTFVVLLVLGGVATCYTLTGRVFRSIAR